jgi:beta-fructofuranosidase
MLYEPTRPDRYLWDTWLVPAEGRYHLFHMQKVAGEPDSLEIGHAVSEDLVRWTMLDPALTLGPPGAWDRFRFRTGTVVAHGGRYHLFYGAAPDLIDRIGVATSTDLLHWDRHAGNPIAEADPRWYEHDATSRLTGTVAWRDPCVVRDGDEWVMYLAARLAQGPPGGRGTIATLRSRDLLRWEVGPPLDVPPGYAVMEVPDVFELDGRWFLLHSTTHRMGTRFPTCDPALTAGTFVLCPAHRMTAYVCRTVATPLGRLAYYHNAYPPPLEGPARTVPSGRPHEAQGSQAPLRPAGPRGSFALPKALAIDSRGLTLRYLPLLEPYRGAPLPLGAGAPAQYVLPPGEWDQREDVVEGLVAYGTSALLLEGTALDALLTATVTIEQGQGAGIALRLSPRGRGLAVILDARRATISVAEVTIGAAGVVWRALAERSVPLPTGAALALRVVLVRDVVDVFLADELLLSVVAEGYEAGHLALLADDARVRFAGLRAWPLAVR